MDSLKIKNKNYYVVRISNDYGRVKVFDKKNKLENYKLQPNEVFVLLSPSMRLESATIRVVVLEVNVKFF